MDQIAYWVREYVENLEILIPQQKYDAECDEEQTQAVPRKEIGTTIPPA